MKPNIVVLLLDAARARNLSCYGHSRETTPFLDSLAKNSHQYNRAFANSIWSLPSYASLFTGQYPTEHGAIDWNKKIGENTLISGLNDVGYNTHAVSTHLVSEKFGIGEDFDSTDLVFVGSRDLPFDQDPVADKLSEYANVHGFDSPRHRYLKFSELFLRNPSFKSLINGLYQYGRRIKRKFGFWGDDGAEAALASAKKTIDGTQEPFFLFMNFVETHDPYRPPRRYIRKFIPDDVSLSELREAVDYSSVRATLDRDEMTERRRDLIKRLYDAEIAYVDDQIRKFHEYLGEQGVLEETVFVVLADHGDSFGNHGLWGHQGGIYNDLCHVPLLIDYPWANGKTVSTTVELREITQHLLNIASESHESLHPSGDAVVEYYGWDTQLSYTPWNRYEGVNGSKWGAYQSAIIDDEWKLILDSNGESELYDMRTDFGEHEDVSNENEGVLDKYRQQLVDRVGKPEENHKEYRDRLSGSSTIFDKNGEVAERLRELGYAEDKS